jgi:hypothetical protein
LLGLHQLADVRCRMSDQAGTGVVRVGADLVPQEQVRSGVLVATSRWSPGAPVTGMPTQGGQGWQGWPRREQHIRGIDSVAAVTGTTSSCQGRGGGGWGCASAAVVEAPAITSTDVPMHDVTVLTGMFQATMEHERPQMQSQTAYLSTLSRSSHTVDQL